MREIMLVPLSITHVRYFFNDHFYYTMLNKVETHFNLHLHI